MCPISRSFWVIMAGEQQEDYDQMAREWNKEFEPETYMERRLVGILIDNDWFLRRAVRRLHEAEAENGKIELMQRYKTSAERSFYRSLNALQQLRRDLMRQDRHAEWWKDRAGKLEKELEKRPPAPVETLKPKSGQAHYPNRPERGPAPLPAPAAGPDAASTFGRTCSIAELRHRYREAGMLPLSHTSASLLRTPDMRPLARWEAVAACEIVPIARK